MPKTDSTSTGNFDILFTKLEEAIQEQREESDLEIDSSPEINETILLFREYQDTVMENSFTTFTRG